MAQPSGLDLVLVNPPGGHYAESGERGTAGELEAALRQGLVRYHAGRLGGAWPGFRSS
jgi:hypothetical protein